MKRIVIICMVLISIYMASVIYNRIYNACSDVAIYEYCPYQ